MKAHLFCQDCHAVTDLECDGCGNPTCDRHLNRDGVYEVCWTCLVDRPKTQYVKAVG